MTFLILLRKSIEGLLDLPIKMMTVHTSGGLKMLEESSKATKKAIS